MYWFISKERVQADDDPPIKVAAGPEPSFTMAAASAVREGRVG